MWHYETMEDQISAMLTVRDYRVEQNRPVQDRVSMIRDSASTRASSRGY